MNPTRLFILGALAKHGPMDGHQLRRDARAAQSDHQRDRMWPDQTVADDLAVEHARLRIQAELTWHRRFLGQLGKFAADSEWARA